MKISKRKFVIIKTEDGRDNIALRKHPENPLDKNGFTTKKATRNRLNEYIRKVNETI